MSDAVRTYECVNDGCRRDFETEMGMKVHYSRSHDETPPWKKASERTVPGREYYIKCIREKGRACTICDSEVNVVVHHVNGEREDCCLDNLVPVCSKCHMRIHRGYEGYEQWTEQLPKSAKIMSAPGPIIFSNRYARSQLVEHGEVITFRGDRTVGETWWTDEYGTCKNGNCTVEQIGGVEPTEDALDEHQPLSGFPTTAAWLDAIGELHGGGSGYLYRVTEVDDDE